MCVFSPWLNIYGEGPPNEITCYHKGQDGTFQNLKTNFEPHLRLISCEFFGENGKARLDCRMMGTWWVLTADSLSRPLLSPSAAAGVICLSRSSSSRGVGAFRLPSGKKKKKKEKKRVVGNLHNGCRRRAKANTARRDFFSSQVICDKRNTITRGSACTTPAPGINSAQKPEIHLTL